jgi:DNA replication protein DnaC
LNALSRAPTSIPYIDDHANSRDRHDRTAALSGDRFHTNLPFKEWGKLFSNAAAASAIADRLVHKGLLIRITGKSRRSDQELSE